MEIVINHQNVTLEKEGKMAWVTFTRERYLNAVDNETCGQFYQVMLALGEDPDVRVVIIRGRGRAFSSGLDLKEFSAGKIGMDYYQRWEEIILTIEKMDKIVILGAHGYCLGGALQLALAADIRVTDPACLWGLPAIKESIIPGMGPWRLPGFVGMGWARRLTLGGENIDGEKALAIGLADHVVPTTDFSSHLNDIGAQYLKTCSTGTRMGKRFMNQSRGMGFEEAFKCYFELQKRCHNSLDAQEARTAYMEKRAPVWQ
ncbi:MAG: enoyl-CoA hydratase/isomerase family protein [Desulfobacterium sp.]|nr:enoyl-CoA hydratase/isomerase family protein [Desulfobacterium sp.]